MDAPETPAKGRKKRTMADALFTRARLQVLLSYMKFGGFLRRQ